ncbi:hypothetical protein ACVXZ4_10950 [Lacisediminihabitans sp. FW035]
MLDLKAVSTSDLLEGFTKILNALVNVAGLRYLDTETCSAILSVFLGLYVVLALQLPKPRDRQIELERQGIQRRAVLVTLLVGPGGIALSLFGIRAGGLSLIGAYVLLILAGILVAVVSTMVLHSIGSGGVELGNFTKWVLIRRTPIPKDSYWTVLAWLVVISVISVIPVFALLFLAPDTDNQTAELNALAPLAILGILSLALIYAILIPPRIAQLSMRRHREKTAKIRSMVDR